MKINKNNVIAIQVYKKIYDEKEQGDIIAVIDDENFRIADDYAIAIQYDDRVDIVNDDRGLNDKS